MCPIRASQAFMWFLTYSFMSVSSYVSCLGNIILASMYFFSVCLYVLPVKLLLQYLQCYFWAAMHSRKLVWLQSQKSRVQYPLRPYTFPFLQEWQLSVTSESMCTYVCNRIKDQRNSVLRLTDRRDMTIAVYRWRIVTKTTTIIYVRVCFNSE